MSAIPKFHTIPEFPRTIPTLMASKKILLTNLIPITELILVTELFHMRESLLSTLRALTGLDIMIPQEE